MSYRGYTDRYGRYYPRRYRAASSYVRTSPTAINTNRNPLVVAKPRTFPQQVNVSSLHDTAIKHYNEQNGIVSTFTDILYGNEIAKYSTMLKTTQYITITLQGPYNYKLIMIQLDDKQYIKSVITGNIGVIQYESITDYLFDFKNDTNYNYLLFIFNVDDFMITTPFNLIRKNTIAASYYGLDSKTTNNTRSVVTVEWQKFQTILSIENKSIQYLGPLGTLYPSV